MDFDLPKKAGLVKLPVGTTVTALQEIVIFLIKAELKNRKFSEHLELVGFDPAYSALDLGSVILQLMDFSDGSDEMYEWYQRKLDDYMPRVILHDDSEMLGELAVELFSELKTKRAQ